MGLEREYTLFREDFTFKGWNHLIEDNSINLIVVDEETIIVSHEDLSLINESDLQLFLLDESKTSNEFDEAVMQVISNNFGAFEFKGDGEGLGFILDLWESETAKFNGDEPINSYTFWFEDFEKII